MPNKKLKWNREELISIVITALFLLGFILVYTDSSNIAVTGQTVQDTLLIQSVSIATGIGQGLSTSDLILFGILPIIILSLLFSIGSYEAVELLKGSKEYTLVKKIIIFLIKYVISLIFVVLVLDFIGFRYVEELTSISTADTILFGVIAVLIITVLFGIISYEIVKLFKKTREYVMVKKIFLFLIKYVLSLMFIILILDFLSSKYLRLTGIIETITTLDILYYVILPILVVSFIFAIIIHFLMKYVE